MDKAEEHQRRVWPDIRKDEKELDFSGEVVRVAVVHGPLDFVPTVSHLSSQNSQRALSRRLFWAIVVLLLLFLLKDL